MANLTKSAYNDADFEDNEIFDDSSLMLHLNKTFDTATLKNVSCNNSALNVSVLCCDEEISGYDKVTGRNWVYPTNYPVRDYQFNIIKSAILKNTLVSLPTGLGKTFIAAVIMYNFYRWYPLGKIVFTAPTRPLVAQQIEACYNIVAIPPNDTVEMTGICPGDKIRCLVIDEAHRARGNYAYCQIVSSLTDMGHKTYRILALSATPGSKVEDVVNVVKNLHIAHLELRSENCLDVAPYSHSRKINTIVVKLGPVLTQIRQQYTEILDQYARRLKQMNILPQNVGNLSKGRVVMLYKEYQNKERGARHPQHNYIMKDFTLLIALFHGLELLIKHGSRVFLNFFDEHPEKSWIQSDDRLTALLERLRDDLGINPLSLNTSILPDGTVPEIPKDLSFGHPKFDKLKEIMINHFKIAKEQKKDTRAIVFCEYRESVNLVHCLLLQCRPLITPQMFVGQGASGKDGKAVVSQKQQLRVMRSFRSGETNALVATCVAEEGLDVGSVDLILCFDISTRSPVRLVQRCGRTGRERGGQVYILVTEGREHQTLMDCMRQRDGLNKKISQSKEVEANLYKSNPRLIPYDFTPECQKMFISVARKPDKDKPGPTDNAKKGQKDLRNMFAKASSSSSASSTNATKDVELITEQELTVMFPEGLPKDTLFAKPKEYWNMSKKSIQETAATGDSHKIKLDTWLEWQRSSQKTINIGHSTDSELLSQLLQYSDAKRFELPASTQNPTFKTQDVITQNIVSSPIKPKQNKKKLKAVCQKSPGKRDGDIRALFSTATKSTKNYTKLINDLGIQDDGSVPTSFINLLVDLSLNNTNSSKQCYICQHICKCAVIHDSRQLKYPPLLLNFLINPKLPDIDLIDDVTVDDITKLNQNENQELLDFSDVLSNRSEINMNANCSNNFDLDFDFDSPVYGDSAEQNNDKILKSDDKNLEMNFDIGEIDDLFDNSSPEEAMNEKIVAKSEKSSSDPKNTLGFFGLDSIDDIFAESGDEVIIESPRTPEKTKTSPTYTEDLNIPKPVSPSILSGRVKSETSPILCSQISKFQLSTKKQKTQTSTPNQPAKRQLLLPTPRVNNAISINDSHGCQKDHSTANTTDNESKLTITQIVEMINKSDKEKSILENCKIPNYTQAHTDGNTSPILLTQADRVNNFSSVKTIEKHNTTSQSQNKKGASLIILESDSDSSADTEVCDLNDNNNTTKNDFKNIICEIQSPNVKRKLDLVDEEPISLSPYFNKKIKLDNDDAKPLTLQEQILAALTTNKENKKFINDTSINFLLHSPKQTSQKENRSPQKNYICSTKSDYDFRELSPNSSLKQINPTISEKSPKKDDLKEIIRSKLQMFKRDSKSNHTPTKQNGSILERKPLRQSRKINDSGDEFVSDQNNDQSYKGRSSKIRRLESLTNHKVRKKKRKANQFLDLEAVLSDEDSGDELTDDSAGSIAEFICDDNETHHNDIQALYLRSVKSPVKGVFKIPELPKQYNNHDIFSQFVEEDNYEMDSFCVDSHIGLTQINEVSALELAELEIESKRRKKQSHKRPGPESGDDSPLVRRKKVARKIPSDSDDSS